MISILAKQLLDEVSQHLPKAGDMFTGNAGAFTENMAEQGSEAHRQLKVRLEAILRKMNLVTRDEFDAQAAVLQRTRERLEILEKQVQQLEQNLPVE